MDFKTNRTMRNKEKSEQISQNHKNFYYIDDGTPTTSALECYHSAMEMAEWKDKEHKDKIDVLEGQVAALDAHLKKAQEALVAMWDKNQLLNQQPITEQGGWHTEPPTFDCFALLMTPAFPKNCHFVVAEWDNDAECFYSESFDFPIEKWDCWKLIQKNWVLENPKYSEEVERIKERNGL